MLMLRDYGTLGVRDVLEPAIFYAEHGHPLLPRVAETIADMADFFREEWPTSAERWLPGGTAPAAGAQIGRAHVWTPVTNAHLVCRPLPETQQTTRHPHS